MEDRMTAELWLEPSDVATESFSTAELDEACRVTWWANANPGRTDLPRRIPEFSTLGLYEADTGFVPPADRPGYHFRRFPRPAQGVLTGEPTIGLLVVLISPKAAEEAQSLRDWADFIHIRHIAEAAVPGYGMITPYERVGGQDRPRFLHLYEITGPDPEAVYRSMTSLVVERLGPPGTPAFDHCARHPSLRIDYVNTFRLVGETAGRPAG